MNLYHRRDEELLPVKDRLSDTWQTYDFREQSELKALERDHLAEQDDAGRWRKTGLRPLRVLCLDGPSDAALLDSLDALRNLHDRVVDAEHDTGFALADISRSVINAGEHIKAEIKARARARATVEAQRVIDERLG